MKNWTVDDIKDNLNDIIQASTQEPQIVYEQDQPIVALVDIDLFQELMALHNQVHQPPSIAQLLDELDQIQLEEPVELEFPSRQDRSNPFLEVMDELSC